jgi:thymidylate synthase (FAD)
MRKKVDRCLYTRRDVSVFSREFEVATVHVLDRGYVRLCDMMGGEIGVVNAARASFASESRELTERDIKLLRYLWEHRHTSPFRHSLITFEVKAPLMVARQWWKYVVGSDHTMEAWNEQSRRYVTEQVEFYLPSAMRAQAKDRKQGSDGEVGGEVGKAKIGALDALYRICEGVYREMLAEGIAGEVARLALPANAQYTTWRWTASLQSVLHFLTERLDDHAQWEIRQYAQAVYVLCERLFANVLALLEEAES